MSSHEHKELGKAAPLSLEDLTRYCKESSAEIQKAFVEAKQSKTASDAIEKMYKIIEKATEYFIKFQTIARTKDTTETQKNLAILSDPSLDDTLQKFSLFSSEIRGERDRDNILQNFRYARTQAIDEDDENLKGLRTLIAPTTTEPKPDIKKTESITTAADARATEIKAAKARIGAAHAEAMLLLETVTVAEAKEAIALAKTCAELLEKFAMVPFTDPELPIDDIHDMIRKIIENFLKFQPLIRTLENKKQAELLLSIATTQIVEFKTVKPYIEKRNLHMPNKFITNSEAGMVNDPDYDHLLYKLKYATDNGFHRKNYETAIDAISRDSGNKVQQEILAEKAAAFSEICIGLLKILKELPNAKPKPTITEIHDLIKDVTGYFVTLQRELRRLGNKEQAQAILDKTSLEDISSFVAYVKKRNETAYLQEDPNDLIKNFLSFKEAPITGPRPRFALAKELAEQKALLLSADSPQKEEHKRTAQIAQKRILEAREKLRVQLTSLPKAPNLAEIQSAMRLIITNSMGIKTLLDNDKVDENTKKIIRPIWQDLQDEQYLVNLKPLLTARFSKQQVDILLTALRKNNLATLLSLEDSAKIDSKEAKQEGRRATLSLLNRKDSVSGLPSKSDQTNGSFISSAFNRLRSSNKNSTRPPKTNSVPPKLSGDVNEPTGTGDSAGASIDLVLIDDHFSFSSRNSISQASAATQFGPRNPANLSPETTPSRPTNMAGEDADGQLTDIDTVLSAQSNPTGDADNSAKSHEGDEGYESGSVTNK